MSTTLKPSRLLRRPEDVKDEINVVQLQAREIADTADAAERDFTEEEEQLLADLHEFKHELETSYMQRAERLQRLINGEATAEQKPATATPSLAKELVSTPDEQQQQQLQSGPSYPNVITPRLESFRPELFGDSRQDAAFHCKMAGYYLRARLLKTKTAQSGSPAVHRRKPDLFCADSWYGFGRRLHCPHGYSINHHRCSQPGWVGAAAVPSIPDGGRNR